MQTTAHVLRIYVGENLRHGPLPVYETLLNRARVMKMAGATVFKSPKGYGHAETAGSHAYRMSIEAPVILEIVDTPENIHNFIPAAKELLQNHGLMTVHATTIVHQGAWPAPQDKERVTA
jgi:PII-like signaling protein